MAWPRRPEDNSGSDREHPGRDRHTRFPYPGRHLGQRDFRERPGGEYGDLDFTDKTVVDIGAHIGAFSVLAALRGARRVLAFEASAENHAMLVVNCEPFPMVECHHGAVWRSDVDAGVLPQSSSPLSRQTGPIGLLCRSSRQPSQSCVRRVHRRLDQPCLRTSAPVTYREISRYRRSVSVEGLTPSTIERSSRQRPNALIASAFSPVAACARISPR